MTDSQRSALYQWERDLIPRYCQPLGSELISLGHCQELSTIIWRRYFPNDAPPIVVPASGPQTSALAYGSFKISLPKWAHTVHTVCHETAHTIIDMYREKEMWRTSDSCPDLIGHGPAFASVLLTLYVEFCQVDRGLALRHGMRLRPRQVRFASPRDIPQPDGRAAGKPPKCHVFGDQQLGLF